MVGKAAGQGMVTRWQQGPQFSSELSRRRPGDTHPTPRWQEGPLASEGFSKSVKLQESLFK